MSLFINKIVYIKNWKSFVFPDYVNQKYVFKYFDFHRFERLSCEETKYNKTLYMNTKIHIKNTSRITAAD